MVKNPPATVDVRDTGSIPVLGRSSGGGHGNPRPVFLPVDRGAWAGYSPCGRKGSGRSEVTARRHAQCLGTLLNVTWQPGRAGVCGENGYVRYMCCSSETITALLLG